MGKYEERRFYTVPVVDQLPMHCAWADCDGISWQTPLVHDGHGHGGLTIPHENARLMYCPLCRRLGRTG